MSSFVWPPSGSLHWLAPVANSGALPATGNQLGDARITTNTSDIYVWNGSTWLVVATPGDVTAITGLTGDVTATGPGSAVASLVAITNSTLTTLSALSLPVSQLTGTLALANGGTAANLTAVNGGLVYSGASAMAITSAGTAGQVILSGGAGAPTFGFSAANPSTSNLFLGTVQPSGFSGANNNVFVSPNASSLTTGTDNTNVGQSAGIGITNGQYNTVMGSNAAKLQSLGSNNVVIGYNAGAKGTNWSQNVYVGDGAGGNANSGLSAGNSANVGIGHNALGQQTSGGPNTAVGANSMYDCTTGSNNVAVGQNSGKNGIGSQNIFIGDTCQGSSGIHNAIAIGYGLTATTNYAVTLGTSANFIGLRGIYAPGAYLEIPAGTATAGTAPLKLNAGTNLTTPVSGCIEFDGTNLYFTNGSGRQTVSTGSGGANTTLSNLASPTAVNQHLIPGTTNTFTLGTNTTYWSNSYIYALNDGNSTTSVAAFQRFLVDSQGNTVMKWDLTTNGGGLLYAPGGGPNTIDWGRELLKDSNGIKSMNWDTRQLFGTDGTTVIASWSSTGGLTIGAASSTPQHSLNTETATGSGTSTLGAANSPGASTPAGWISIVINGTTQYIPYF